MDEADLELLGYSSKWVEYGLLTPEFLEEQVTRFHTGEDRNTEHYRYAAFKQLQRRETFSDLELEQYVELASADPDPGMGTAALVDLVHHPGLTETQWEVLVTHSCLQTLPRLVKKWRLYRELRRPELTDEIYWRCVNEGDGNVHRAVVEALHQRGGNKAVRNIAGVRLKHGPYHADEIIIE
jgi:hypothetical protein